MNRNQNVTTTWHVDIPISSYSDGTAGRLAAMLRQRSDVVMEYHDDEEVYVMFDRPGKDRSQVEAITGPQDGLKPVLDEVIELLGEWYPWTIYHRDGTAPADDTGYVDDRMQPQPEQVINDLDMIEELATDFDMAAMLDGEYADEVADFIYDSV